MGDELIGMCRAAPDEAGKERDQVLVERTSAS
jgi:hypothetical protein